MQRLGYRLDHQIQGSGIRPLMSHFAAEVLPVCHMAIVNQWEGSVQRVS